MMDRSPQSPDLNPIEALLFTLWLELQKAWDNFSVEVLRKYIDTMPERCAAVIAAKGGTYQILKLKVDKNCTTHFIWYLLCSEQPSVCFLNIMKLNPCFGSKKAQFSDLSGVLIILATTVYMYFRHCQIIKFTKYLCKLNSATVSTFISAWK